MPNTLTSNKPQTTTEPTKSDVLRYIEPPIPALEARIRQLQNSPGPKSKSKSTVNKIAEYQSEIKRKIHAAKLAAKKIEDTNRAHLYFINSTANWTKLTFNSALFFETDVRPRLKSPNRFHLKADLDNYAVSSNGIISLRLDDSLIRELATLGITKDADFYQPDITVFKLPWQYASRRKLSSPNASPKNI